MEPTALSGPSLVSSTAIYLATATSDEAGSLNKAYTASKLAVLVAFEKATVMDNVADDTCWYNSGNKPFAKAGENGTNIVGRLEADISVLQVNLLDAQPPGVRLESSASQEAITTSSGIEAKVMNFNTAAGMFLAG